MDLRNLFDMLYGLLGFDQKFYTQSTMGGWTNFDMLVSCSIVGSVSILFSLHLADK